MRISDCGFRIDVLSTLKRYCVTLLLASLYTLSAAASARSPVFIKDPEQRKAYYKAIARGELAGAVGKWEQACDAFREATRIAPDVVEGHQAYQDAMEQLGKREELLAQYRSKLERQPDSALVHYLLGRIASDLAEKEKLLLAAVRLDPSLSWAYYALGHLYEHAEKWNQSESAFRKVTELRPNWAEGHNALGFCFLQQGKNDAAEAAFKKALDTNPRYVDALVNLGVIALRGKQYARTVEYSRKALEIDKSNPKALNNLGKAYYYQGLLRDAVEAYKKALESPDVDRPEVVYLNLGFCYYRMQEFDQAAAAYERAVSINPTFGYGYYCLAQAKYRQKAYEDAWKAVRQAEKLGYDVRRHERFLKMLSAELVEPGKP
ncbi:MAG TPA: tetratricopeptide repeat protein [Candidatus Hydrogenedentes bacterium]|nr:tetratricopeptide repeat protein [Candidatus Hydrogenedentota bacterium]